MAVVQAKVDPQILANVKHARTLKKQQEQRAKKWLREREKTKRREGPFNGIKGIGAES